jgi:hypothetical protein
MLLDSFALDWCGMPRVLIVASPATVSELERTVLWRSGIERVFAVGHDPMQSIRGTSPQMVLLGDDPTGGTEDLLREIRKHPDTKRVSVAVIAHQPDLAREDRLRKAGANVVFAGEVVPCLWDGWLEQLLSVPPRREARLPVRFEVWCRSGTDSEAVEGMSVNVSLKGMLLETEHPSEIGSRLDLRFCLPGDEQELRTVAQVVREEPRTPVRLGVSFLILRDSARERIRGFVASQGA